MRSIWPIPLLLLVIVWSHPKWPTALIGAAVVAVGEMIRLWVAGYLGAFNITDADGDRQLVVARPYSLVRHPHYWGNFFIGLGLSLISQWWIGYGVFIFYCIMVLCVLIPVEEEMLEKQYGEAYREYVSRTNRFLPRPSSMPVSACRYNVYTALRGERFMLISLCCIGLCFAIKWLFLIKQA